MESRAVNSVVVGVSAVLAAMLLSAAGVVVVRRYADVEWLEGHHQIAGYFVAIIGTLYAVLLALPSSRCGTISRKRAPISNKKPTGLAICRAWRRGFPNRCAKMYGLHWRPMFVRSWRTNF